MNGFEDDEIKRVGVGYTAVVIDDGFLEDNKTVGVSMVGRYDPGGGDSSLVVVSGIDDVCAASLCGTEDVDGLFVDVDVVVLGACDEWFSSEEDSSTILTHVLNRNEFLHEFFPQAKW